MKGFLPEDIGITLVFLLLIMLLSVFVLLIYLVLVLPSLRAAETGYSIEFINVANKPFVLTEVLSQVRFGDRSFFEQAIEITATGSATAASSPNIINHIKNFMDFYKIRVYYVSIVTDAGEITAESSIQKCGSSLEGFCTSRKLMPTPTLPPVFPENCDVGRIEIADSNMCSLGQVCCKYDTAAYQTQSPKFGVVSCADNKGVCSVGRYIYSNPVFTPLPVFTWSGPFCDAGEIYYNNVECKDANGGKTPLCCGEENKESLIESIRGITAVVPLLYKNLEYGTLEVVAK